MSAILVLFGCAAILVSAFHFGSWWGVLGGAGVILLNMAVAAEVAAH